MKTTLVILTLVGAFVSSSVHAAAGIKGGRQAGAEESQFRAQAVKGLRPPVQQQPQYLPPPPPPPPPAAIEVAPIAPLPLPPQPVPVAGPGQVTPVFSAIRVQPAPVPIVQQPQPQIVQQQQQQLVQQQEQEPEPVQQTQQQQQEEIDPNAAAQDSAPAVAAPAAASPAVAAPAAASEEEANPRPEPYAFQYAFNSGDAATSGSSAREEQQDASGRVTGFYTLKGEDGRDRRVDYVADASGFRATISTNELGTAPKDSADVDWNAQNPSDAQVRAAEAATQEARQRALLNPVQQQPIASSSAANFQKISSPRQKGAAAAAAASAASSQRQVSKANPQQQQQQQQQVQIGQLQEPFEQIRQTELKSRARKSRHAPFYLFTI